MTVNKAGVALSAGTGIDFVLPAAGIGGAIVKKIVERHVGRIRVESQPEPGSASYLTPPLSVAYEAGTVAGKQL